MPAGILPDQIPLANMLSQRPFSWQPEPVSLLLGLLAGLLLGALLYRRLWPAFSRLWQRLAHGLHRAFNWLQSDQEQRYRAQLVASLEGYHLLAVVAGRNDPVKLSQVFAAPRLVAPPAEPELESTAELGPRQLHWLWPELAAGVGVPPPQMVTLGQMLRQGRRVLLAGPPGAGKSTLLAYCAIACAQAQASPGRRTRRQPLEALEVPSGPPFAFLQPYLPLFAHLADFRLETAQDDVVAALAEAACCRLESVRAGELAELLRPRLAAGLVLLLLDGWDELPASSQQATGDWLGRLLARYPQTRLIMAAPARGYAPLLPLEFVVSGIVCWRAGVSQVLAAHWAEATGQEPLPLPRFWRPGQAAWQTAARLQLASGSGDDGANGAAPERPQRDVELMEAALRQRMPQASGDPPWLAPVARDLWQQMAFLLLNRAEAGLAAPQLEALMAHVLEQYQVDERGAARRLRQATTGSGLFTPWQGDGLRFLSPVWRDYLAAGHLAQGRQARLVGSHLLDEAWRGAARFFVGRAGAGNLARLLLERDEEDLLLDKVFHLAQWLPEAADQGEWRRQVLLRLGRLVTQRKVPAVLRQRALLALAQSGESSVRSLVRQSCQTGDTYLRQAAVSAVTLMGDDEALELLAEAFHDNLTLVRQAAVHALAWMHRPGAEPFLLQALAADDDGMRQAAVEGLALNGADWVPLLQEAATAEDARLRRASVFGLVLLDEPWVLPRLQEMQYDEQWAVQSVAAAALELLTSEEESMIWRPPDFGNQAWLINWAAQRGRGVPAGAGAVAVVREALADGQPKEVRLASINALGQVDGEESLPALRAALRDADAHVREAAFMALCALSRAHGGWVGGGA